ncbi:MAG: hypothetical protein Q8R04_04210 [Nanoarchaeota archaeon]|nr:hypothetical protein [Nanoarchaeota archaeon]
MKKAIFFTIDSLLASGIIITAVLLVSNFYLVEHQNVNVEYASQDLIKVFSTLTVSQVDNDYVKSLVSNGDITNMNNTILEQIGDFWANDKLNLSANFTKNLTEDVIPKNYGFGVLINDENIYTRNLTIKRGLVSSRSLVSGISNNSFLWGPAIIEIRVWE